MVGKDGHQKIVSICNAYVQKYTMKIKKCYFAWVHRLGLVFTDFVFSPTFSVLLACVYEPSCGEGQAPGYEQSASVRQQNHPILP